MIGKYPAKLDDKNRLFVPAKLRGELGEDFFVTLGVNCGHRCLTVYTDQDWQLLSQNYNALPISQRGAATSLIFMNASQCSPDKQFRFGLTQFLLDYAGIKRDVVIVGLADKRRYGTQRNSNVLKKRISRLKNCWPRWRQLDYERISSHFCVAG